MTRDRERETVREEKERERGRERGRGYDIILPDFPFFGYHAGIFRLSAGDTSVRTTLNTGSASEPVLRAAA